MMMGSKKVEKKYKTDVNALPFKKTSPERENQQIPKKKKGYTEKRKMI